MPPLKLLLVEDSVDDAQLILRELRQAGIAFDSRRIDTQPELAEALAEQWDAVLCDYTLPGWDGFAALHEIRETVGAMPFIFVSGSVGEDVAVAAMRAGADDYMLKDNLRRLGPALLREVASSASREHARVAEEDRLLSEVRYGQVVETAADAIITIDSDQIIRSFNRGAERIFGHPSQLIIGQLLDVLIPESSRESHRRHVAHFIDSPQSELPMSSRGDIAGLRADGSEFPAQASLSKAGTGAALLCTAILRDVTALKHAEERIRFLAHYDPLTHLANRILFREHLEVAIAEARRKDRFVGVCLVDLDRFKSINDTRGHGAGDQMLAAVASRLSGAVRGGDTLARLGGDEFGLILADLDRPEDAGRIAETVLTSLRFPLMVGPTLIRTAGSIGITICPTDGVTFEDLLANADLAMYRAKRAGGDQAEFYVPEMTRRERERAQIESDLFASINAKGLHVAYQPQVATATGETIGVEALARWKHPLRGQVPAEQFISVAEDAGLIRSVCLDVLDHACADSLRFRKRNGADLRIGVNVSASQMRTTGFAHEFLSHLERAGVDPRLFQVEITESVFADDEPNFVRALEELHGAGIGLAIDDFGTGYSNLSRLKQLPVSSIKLDMSLVRLLPGSEDDRAVAEAAIAMSQRLGMECVAEGVETREQLQYLTDVGCDLIQGFYLSPPLLFEDAGRWLWEHGSRHGSMDIGPSADGPVRS